MLNRLLGRRNENQNDFDYMIVEFYSFPGKAQDQFRRGQMVDAEVRDGDAVADVTETLFVPLDFFVTQLFEQSGYRGLLAESLDNLREFALKTVNDLGRLKQLGDHGEGLKFKV